MRTLLAALFLLVLPAAHADSTPDAIEAEIRADLRSDLENVDGKTWTVRYMGTECIELAIEPKGAFEIEKISANRFEVTLDRPSRLYNGNDGLLPLRFIWLGCGEPELRSETEIGVVFPKDLEDLQDDDDVKSFRITWDPPKAAELLRIEEDRAYFRRAQGQETTPVTVTVSYQIDGKGYSMRASLPRAPGTKYGTVITPPVPKKRDELEQMAFTPIGKGSFRETSVDQGTALRRVLVKGHSLGTETCKKLIDPQCTGCERVSNARLDTTGFLQKYEPQVLCRLSHTRGEWSCSLQVGSVPCFIKMLKVPKGR